MRNAVIDPNAAQNAASTQKALVKNPLLYAFAVQMRLGVTLGAGHSGLAHEGGAYGH